jgi:CheY-like chemotaxis protein
MDIENVDMNFPLAMAPTSHHIGSPDSRGERAGNRPSLHGRNILVVEDESIVALLIEDALEEEGASVVGPCYTLNECLRAARSEDIDAAVLDVDLAGQDVFPAADELKKRGIPFVFHTAHAYREEIETRFGGVPICRKPVAMDELIVVLKKTVGPATN